MGDRRLPLNFDFWHLPAPDLCWTEKDAVAAIRETLMKAVDDHLIAGLAVAHCPRPRAFTVRFADQPDFDELDIAAATVKRFGLKHVAFPLPAAEVESAAGEWLG